MQITVKGRNVDVPANVRDEAIEKFSKVRKLFDRFIDMEVVFSEEANPRITDKYRCEVVLHAKGRAVRATATAPDMPAAIDRAQSKLTQQTRKFKTQVIDRSRRSTRVPQQMGAAPLEE